MDENPQEMEIFIARQTRKRHLAAIWADLAGLKPGMVVADIGCGPGILTREYAAILGPNGVVYAIESNEALARYSYGLVNNVHILFQNYDSEIKIEHTLNIAFLTDKLRQLPHPELLLRRIHDACGPHTKLLITEYDPKKPGLVGAKPHRRMAPERLIALVEAAGFTHGDGPQQF